MKKTLYDYLCTVLPLSYLHKELNDKYKYLSCIDYSKEYEYMDELQTSITKTIEEMTLENDISTKGLTQAIGNIICDIDKNSLENAQIYTQDEFIEYIVKEAKMLRSEARRFTDMLAWMQEKERASYIEARFILEWKNTRDHNKCYYYDARMSFVIVVDKA